MQSELITSDSDFELEAKNAGHASMILFHPPAETGFEKKRSVELRKDVSKTFKKCLTSNHNRASSTDRMDNNTPNGGFSDGKKSALGESTRYDGNS